MNYRPLLLLDFRFLRKKTTIGAQKNINDSEIFIKKNAYGDVANINAENTTS